MNSSPESNDDKINMIKDEIDRTKQYVDHSISLIIERGEKLEDLVDKSENLNENAKLFNTHSRRLKNKMFWRRVKTGLVLFLILFFIIFILLMSICGIRFQHC